MEESLQQSLMIKVKIWKSIEHVTVDQMYQTFEQNRKKNNIQLKPAILWNVEVFLFSLSSIKGSLKSSIGAGRPVFIITRSENLSGASWR